MLMAAAEIDGYIRVSLATISPSDVTNFALFIRDDRESPVRLYRDANYPFDPENLQRLIDRGVKHLYVTSADHELYQEYLRKNFVAILNDDTLPIQRRFGCLNEVVRDILSEAFTCGEMASTVDTVKQLAVQTVELICQGEMLAGDLLRVLHHDYHTFTHSANVAYYCVLLAKAAGFTDRAELCQIATGALLHDIGKLNIPEQIIKKGGRLNDDEWDAIKRHPADGFRLLAHRDDLNFAQLMMVYQHHERLDGSGYPVGIGEDRIHPWAQLCAIVDVFEALTSQRPYRPRLSLEEAVAILERQAGVRLNQGLWECWKTIIQNA